MKMLGLILTLLATTANAQVKILDGQYPIGIKAPTNYVKNIGCYQNKADLTASGGTFIRNTSSPLNASIGADCKWTPSASSQTLTMTLKAFDPVLKNQNCAVSLPYSGGGTGIKIGVKRNSVTISEQDLTTPLSGTSVATLIFTCGDLTNATTIVLTSTIASPAAIEWSGTTVGLNEGVFQTDVNSVWTDGGAITVDSTGSGQVKGSTTYDHFWYKRNGSNLDVNMSYAQTGTGTDGTGQYLFKVPTTSGCIIDTARVNAYTGTDGAAVKNIVGTAGVMFPGTAGATGHVYIYDTTHVSIVSQTSNAAGIYRVGGNTGPAAAGWFGFGLTDVGWNASFSVPCSGWVPLTAIEAKNANFDWTTWAPTSTNGSFGTITPVTCVYKREGPNLKGLCTFSASVVNGSIAQIDLPMSLTTADTDRLAYQPNGANTATVVGKVSRSNNSVPNIVVLAEPNVTYLTFGLGSGGTAEMTENGTSALFSVNEKLSMQFEVPIKGWAENQNTPQILPNLLALNYSTNSATFSDVIPVTYDTVIESKNGGVLVGGVFTSPRKTCYRVTYSASSQARAINLCLRKNSSGYIQISNGSGGAGSPGFGSMEPVCLNATDTLDVVNCSAVTEGAVAQHAANQFMIMELPQQDR